MFHRLTAPAFAAALLLLPVFAKAGGPPMMCLPIDGASSATADACAQLAISRLDGKVTHASLRKNDGQWYLTFNFNRDNIRLAEIDAALAGSPYSIRRDKLRIFGDVILEIDLRRGSADKLLADLKAVQHVSIVDSNREGDKLLVTLKLPAPLNEFRLVADFGKVPFKSHIFRHESNTEPTVGLGDLPSYDTLRKLVAKHDGTLQGLRWDCWGCRALGCVAGADIDRAATQSVSAR